MAAALFLHWGQGVKVKFDLSLSSFDKQIFDVGWRM